MVFNISTFKNSKIESITRDGEAVPGLKRTVMYVTFQLDGQEFMALNGGPHFTFLPAISFGKEADRQECVQHM